MDKNRPEIYKAIAMIVAFILSTLVAFSAASFCLTESDTLTNVGGLLLLGGYVMFVVWFGGRFFRVVRVIASSLERMLPMMIVIGVSVSSVLLTGCMGCERIDPGNVGIKVNLTGDDKGVSKTELVSGRVFYNSFTTDILEYPTYVQTAQWSANTNDSASGTNEEITFNSKENMAISADVSLSYAIERDKVSEFYVKYRNDDLAKFTHGIMRNVARDAFNEIAGTYAVEDIMGVKKEEFLEAVKKRVNERLSGVGVKIDQFGFIGALRPPTSIINAINAKLAATQAAQQAENELRTATAEAKKAEARALGEGASAIARAEAAAKSRIAIAEGEAKANALLNQSITPALIEWRRLSIQEQAINRWNGARPMVEGSSSGLLMQLPNVQK